MALDYEKSRQSSPGESESSFYKSGQENVRANILTEILRSL